MSRLSRENEVVMAEARLQRNGIGFWLYLMTDCVLFASLFATYGVLHGNTFGGPGAGALFHLSQVFLETLILLASSYACGVAVLRARSGETVLTVFWLAVTFALGATFLGIEVHEFADLIASGNGPSRSGFLSSFFTLVATHGIHIAIGLIWILTMAGQIATKGLSEHVVRRLTLFGLFWHFLDVVWIFIFTAVYLLGVA